YKMPSDIFPLQSAFMNALHGKNHIPLKISSLHGP
ncbi:Hypothetical protein EIN_084490, partial [Entamoeba invadens IP1]